MGVKPETFLGSRGISGSQYLGQSSKTLLDYLKEFSDIKDAEFERILSDIDLDLAAIEDYAHGDEGDAITSLRHKTAYGLKNHR